MTLFDITRVGNNALDCDAKHREVNKYVQQLKTEAIFY